MQFIKKLMHYWTIPLAVALGIIAGQTGLNLGGYPVLILLTFGLAAFLGFVQARRFWLPLLIFSLSIDLFNIFPRSGDWVFFAVEEIIIVFIGGSLGHVIRPVFNARGKQTPGLKTEISDTDKSSYSTNSAVASSVIMIVITVITVASLNLTLPKTTLSTDAYSVKFSPDGKYLVTATPKGIEVWNVSADTVSYNKLLYDTPSDYWVYNLEWSPNGQYLAFDTGLVQGSSDVKVLSWPDGATKFTLKANVGNTHVTSISFSPDNTRLVTTNGSNDVKIWSLTDGSLLKPISSGTNITQAVFNKDGLLGIADNIPVITLMDLESRQVQQLFAHDSHVVEFIAFSKNGKLVAGSTGNGVEVWDTQSKKLIHTINDNSNPIRGITFGMDDKFVVVGTASRQDSVENKNKDHGLHVWQISNGTLVKTLQQAGFDDDVFSMDFNPFNGYLASTDGKFLSLWKP